MGEVAQGNAPEHGWLSLARARKYDKNNKVIAR
jgi:hypothetical protein